LKVVPVTSRRLGLRSLFGFIMMVATQKQMPNDIVAAKIEIHMT